MRWICLWCAIVCGVAQAQLAQDDGFYAPQTFRNHVRAYHRPALFKPIHRPFDSVPRHSKNIIESYNKGLFTPASGNDASPQGSLDSWRPAPAPVHEPWREYAPAPAPLLPQPQQWRAPQPAAWRAPQPAAWQAPQSAAWQAPQQRPLWETPQPAAWKAPVQQWQAPKAEAWSTPRPEAWSAPKAEAWSPPAHPSKEQKANIIHHKQALSAEGAFKYEYASDNGLTAGEVIEPDGSRVGAYQYTDPNGQLVKVKYRAGKDGFQILEGSHLPKSPEPVAPQNQDHHYQQAYEQQRQQYELQQQHNSHPTPQQQQRQGYEDGSRAAAGQEGSWRAQGKEDDGQYRENEIEEDPHNRGPHSFGEGYAFEFQG